MRIERGWKDSRFPPECRKAMWNGTCRYMASSGTASASMLCDEDCILKEKSQKYMRAAILYEQAANKKPPCHFEQGSKWKQNIHQKEIIDSVRSGTRRHPELRE